MPGNGVVLRFALGAVRFGLDGFRSAFNGVGRARAIPGGAAAGWRSRVPMTWRRWPS